MRGVAFLAVFFLFWITPSPFVDLRDPDVLLATENGNGLDQICLLLAFAPAVAFAMKRQEAVRLACSPALLALLAWCVVTVVTSTHPDLSVRRFVLAVLVIAISLGWLLIPRDEVQFSRLLAVGSGGVLALAYFGVLFLPAVSIHNLAEVLELDNAGSWRGHFPHKNLAGAAMVYLMAYGLYVAHRQGRPAGWTIAALAFVFLVQTHNKTSLVLVAGTFALATMTERAGALWLKACLTLLPVATMLLFTVGSVLFPPIEALVTMVAPDPTYTNRTMIWSFALVSIARHPFLGYGFDAFWSTSELVDGGGVMETAAVNAGHAHDGYLNVALTTGLPGLALMAFWIMWQPLRHFHRAQRAGQAGALATMYLRIWLFTLLYACLESPFFIGHWPMWFGFLGAVFGLRLQALAIKVSGGTGITSP